MYQRNHPDVKMEDLVIYTTTQTHSLGAKAGIVLGLQVRSIEVLAEDKYSLRGHALRDALEEDRKLGRKPFILRRFCSSTCLARSIDVIDSCHRRINFLGSYRQLNGNS